MDRKKVIPYRYFFFEKKNASKHQQIPFMDSLTFKSRVNFDCSRYTMIMKYSDASVPKDEMEYWEIELWINYSVEIDIGVFCRSLTV